MWEFAIALLLGIVVGTFTGLTPSIHINLVSTLVVSLLPTISSIEPISGAIFVAALAVTHTTIDFIPSIYLGAPNDETALTVLPAHKLLKEGKGHEAAMLALRGSLWGLMISILIALPIIIFSPSIIKNLSNITPLLIIFLASYLLLKEKRIVPALISFFLSGILGYLCLNTSVKEPLLPLLSGLFGASGLVLSLKDKSEIIKQKIDASFIHSKPKKKELAIYSAIGAIFSILPALGSGYASLVSSEIKENDSKKFIFSVGFMNMLIMVSSFSFVYATEKARTGAAAAISVLLNSSKPSQIIIILTTCILSGLIAYIIGKKISEKSAMYITKINYRVISLCALILMIIVILIFSNFLGLLVFLIGTSIGIFTTTSEVKRTTMMGCLIIPTLIYYLF